MFTMQGGLGRALRMCATQSAGEFIGFDWIKIFFQCCMDRIDLNHSMSLFEV